MGKGMLTEKRRARFVEPEPIAKDEEFRPIKGFDYYLVSNYGRVYSYKKNRFIGKVDDHNYPIVTLYGNKFSGVKKDVRIHRLVCEAFVPNPNGYKEVNHKDENTMNNRADNLEWCTSDYNLHYGTRIERCAIGHRKKVEVYQNGKYIASFASIKDAAQGLGVDRSSISDWMLGRVKSNKGYEIMEIKNDK